MNNWHSWCGGLMLAGLPALAAAAGMPLPGTTWQLVAIQSMDDAQGTTKIKQPRDFTLAFGQDGRATLRLDCNRGMADYRITPAADGSSGGLTFGPIAATRALCPPPHLDNRIARHGVCAFLPARGWQALPVVDGRWRHLRMGAVANAAAAADKGSDRHAGAVRKRQELDGDPRPRRRLPIHRSPGACRRRPAHGSEPQGQQRRQLFQPAGTRFAGHRHGNRRAHRQPL
ncbi:MAG: META domain-containing protein [Betaproteobacteria bacterium]|nr:META domain-containing protein [Betaproteobacteria bacterium]